MGSLTSGRLGVANAWSGAFRAALGTGGFDGTGAGTCAIRVALAPTQIQKRHALWMERIGPESIMGYLQHARTKRCTRRTLRGFVKE
jgi:hypothetical protein